MKVHFQYRQIQLTIKNNCLSVIFPFKYSNSTSITTTISKKFRIVYNISNLSYNIYKTSQNCDNILTKCLWLIYLWIIYTVLLLYLSV